MPARRPRTQRTECQASERRNKTKHHPAVYLVLPSLAFSASRLLSPSPDKSETEVVKIAKSPHRVHQIEPVMRQYCSIFYLSLSRYYLCPSLFSNCFAVIHSSLPDDKIVIGEMRQQRNSTLDTSRQLCLSYIYRLDWTSTGFDGTMHEYTISAGDREAFKLHSVIFRAVLSTRFLNSLLFQRTVLISVQTHQTTLHECLLNATKLAKTSTVPIPGRKL